jgi:predicted transcriptional regulator
MSQTGTARRGGVPRMIGEPLSRKPWTPEHVALAREMRAAGASTNEIAAAVGRSADRVRSRLNRDNHHHSQAIPLAKREAGLTVKRCRKCEADKPLEDFAVTKMNKTEYRWPYCKPCEIARQADRRERGLHLEKTRRHVAKHAEKYPEETAARKAFAEAVRSGRIVRPDTCEACGQKPAPNRLGRSSVQGHHDDYSKPFEVRWLCQPCHNRHHKNLAAARSDTSMLGNSK